MKIEITLESGEKMEINVTEGGIHYTGKPLADGAAASPGAEEAVLDLVAEEYLALVRAQARSDRAGAVRAAQGLRESLRELVEA